MYFLRRLRPIEVAGERVRALRVSLNTPVLSTPDLPVGPARALIVVHQEARGRMDVTVGVRALRGGEVAYWSFDGDLISEDDLAVAGDAALSFAESLGFLFDEDALGSGPAAAKAWRGWIGGEAPATARDPDDTLEAAELLLEDLVEERAHAERPARAPKAALEPKRAPEPVPAPEPAARQASPPAAQLAAAKRSAPPTLSKFRGRADAHPKPAGRAQPAHAEPARAQQAGCRSSDAERQALLRILSSF